MGVRLKILETLLRTNREALMRRADELGVSLAISNDHDGVIDSRAFRCADGTTKGHEASKVCPRTGVAIHSESARALNKHNRLPPQSWVNKD
jgi:hypothetical protein